MKKVTAIYPGSFDPPTNGHLDLVERGSKIFDELIVAVLRNSEKTPLFSVGERRRMLEDLTDGFKNVRVDVFDGLTVDYASRVKASAMLREAIPAELRRIAEGAPLPALGEGRIVLSDRWTDSTMAYQGYGRGVDLEMIRDLNLRATGGILPDLTLLFDLSPAEGFRRIGGRRLDRFEQLGLGFHRRVRRGYLELCRAEPKRVRRIDAARTTDAVAADVRTIVEEALARCRR